MQLLLEMKFDIDALLIVLIIFLKKALNMFLLFFKVYPKLSHFTSYLR